MQANAFPPSHALLSLSLEPMFVPVMLQALALLPPALLVHEQLGLQASQYWVVFAVCVPGDSGV
jgi:hypothetical protein